MHRFASAVSQNLGTRAEALFGTCLQASGRKWAKASFQSNTRDHIDYHIFGERTLRRDGYGTTNIDVKGLKRLRAAKGYEPQSTYIHVEVEAAGAAGVKSGWLYGGRSQYIAFQLHPSHYYHSHDAHQFLMVERKRLLAYVDTHVRFNEVEKEADKAVYTKYTRVSRGEHRGSVTLLPLQDIMAHVQGNVILTSAGKFLYV